jgi:hypothetical protein
MRIKSPQYAFSILLLLSFCTSLLTPSSVAAQADDKEQAQKELERRKDLDRKTTALLDEIVSASWSLKLPENRLMVLASVADLMWPRDEKRARNLYWEAFNSLGLQSSAALDDSTNRDATAQDRAPNDGTARRSASDQAQTLKQYHEMFGLRRDFFLRVAQRDPQLALEMLRSTRLRPPESAKVNYRLPDERDLEQEIANAAVARDPKQALRIARESLAKGITFQLLALLFNLNRLSPDTASEFAGDLIDKLQTTNVTADAVAWRISLELLRLSRTRNEAAAAVNSTMGPNQLRLNDDQKRELVELLVDAALGVSAPPALSMDLSEVMAEVEQFAADRAPKIRSRMAETRRTLTKEEKEWQEYNSLVDKGTPEELVKAAAAKSGEVVRRELYMAAVLKAIMQNKADALREFIKGNVEDEGQRNTLNRLLNENQLSWAANRGDVEELRRLLPLVTVKTQRAEAMANIAMLLEKKGEHEEAVKMLDDAFALVKVDLSSETQSNALMAVLLAYSLIDSARAFGIIEPIIDRANDDISRLLLLDRVVKSGAVKNGEIIMQQPGIPLDFAFLKFAPGVVAMANADFNRTRAAADRFQRNELRIMARLMIAQALLRDPARVPKVGGD